MEPYETHLGLGVALAVGLLVGMEREQSKLARGTGHLGGIRTYPIFALLGALATLLASVSPWLPLVALAGVFALVAISYFADVHRDQDHGMTTEASVIGVYLLGSLAVAHEVLRPMQSRLVLVAMLGVVLTFLLSSKQRFHALAARVSHDDLYATVKFLIVAVVVLPLLPDEDLGPLAAINPRSLGLMVVTISGLSFLGYVAMRLYGARRGLLLGAALGGLVSSTAVTLSFANRTKATPALAATAAGAIAVAWTIMLGRVAVLVALIDPALLRSLAVPLGAMIAAAVVGLALTFKRDGEPAEMALQNPFELGAAVKVSLMFGLVLLVTKAATVYLGPEGLYVASALSGTTDVDAVTLSTAKLAREGAAAGGVTDGVATIAIALAIGANTVVKTALAGSVGGPALGRRMMVVGGLVIAAGAAGVLATVAIG